MTDLIVGAGPAGLTAAYELVKLGRRPLVVERRPRVGGISRTEEYKGYRFDIGGHRFYTRVAAIEELWHEVLGDAFLPRPRLSRIYYHGDFFPYPLKIGPTLRQLGLVESARVFASYLHAHLFPTDEEETFEQWVSNRFGRRLFETFFKSYTEKVWGIPTSEIRAEWAAQRIKGLSLRTAVLNAIWNGRGNVKSLIDSFYYPSEGPGMMWEAFRAEVEGDGGFVCTETTVTRLRREGRRITSVLMSDTGDQPSRHLREEPTTNVISSMPLQALIAAIDPPPPAAVRAAAQGLRYRAFILVGLIVDQAESFPDNWIYIHEPAVQVGRIQNFKNWSPAMVPDPTFTSLGMEYFCDESDDLWKQSDESLIALARREVAQLGLVDGDRVVDAVVIRQPKAYPIYDGSYQAHLAVIRSYVAAIENLQTIGRNGMHRYNNQDHSMLTGILAARNVAGAEHDLWAVNTERSYYEEWVKDSPKRAGADQPPLRMAS